jgi:hypothetical protein
MRLEHQLGRIELIRWQGRVRRGARPGPSVWTILRVLCAIVGTVTLALQALGLLSWTGPFAALPAMLTILGLAAPLWSGARRAMARSAA